MSHCKIILLLFTYLLSLSGCTDSGIFLVNRLASFSEYSAVENIPYGQDTLQSLSVYRPEPLPPNQVKTRPSTIIFFYGGCWGGCQTRNKEAFLFVAEAITSRGHLAVLVDYRRHPAVKFPAIIDDVRRAVEWVHLNIAQYGGDPQRLFLMGHSAGAQLGAMLTLDETYLTPSTYVGIRGFIGLAGPYDFLPFTEPYQKIVFGPETRYDASQPIHFVDGTEPPLLLLYGNDDTTVKLKNLINLSQKVRERGGMVKTLVYEGIDHAGLLAALSIPLRSTTPIYEDIFQFVRQQDL